MSSKLRALKESFRFELFFSCVFLGVLFTFLPLDAGDDETIGE